MSFLKPFNFQNTNQSVQTKFPVIIGALALMIASGPASGPAYGQVAQPIPAEYQALATQMQSSLTSFTASMHSNWNGARSPVVYSAQLRTASSNEGVALIDATHQPKVDAELQALQALGVNAVTVHIDFPLFYAPYYSNATVLQEYEQFYVQLANEVRARGLKLIVETQLMKFSTPQLTYARELSWTAYQAGRAQNAVMVAKLLHPDYMVVITEPDTELSFSQQAPVGTLTGSVQMLTTILAALQQAGMSSVPVGAGVGTWMSSPTSWITAYAALPVSFLDIHVYPTNRAFLPNALAMADAAHKAGKPITMSEAWLQKVEDSELAGDVTATDSRNPFSYWAPLDAQFLQAMITMANYKQFAFISPFWTSYYYAYSSTTETDAANEATAANLIGEFTSTGRAYEKSILLSPDTSAPQVPAAPAVNKAGNSIQLSWHADSDNVGVAGYNVFRSGKAIGQTFSTTYLDSTPGAGPVFYDVSAFDAEGNTSVVSSETQVRTQ